MLILDKTRINILVDVHFLIPTFQVVLIHINKVGNRINKVGHETTKWVNESTKWVNESTSWTAPNQPRGSRQLYGFAIDVAVTQEIPVNPSQSQRKNAKVFVHCFNCNMTFRRYAFNIYTFKWVKQIFQKPGCRHDYSQVSQVALV